MLLRDRKLDSAFQWEQNENQVMCQYGKEIKTR